MSQIEQEFRIFLGKHPEIEKAYQAGLINRRALARHLIKHGVVRSNQLEATIAMLRRYLFQEQEQTGFVHFQDTIINIKDKILILDFEKDKALLQKLQTFISQTDYDKGDTLKIVVGSSSITLFIDQKKESVFKEIIEQFKVNKTYRKISEMSIQFPGAAIETKGVISFVARELALHDIIITELLTANNELLIYIREAYVLKAYEVLKRLQEASEKPKSL